VWVKDFDPLRVWSALFAVIGLIKKILGHWRRLQKDGELHSYILLNKRYIASATLHWLLSIGFLLIISIALLLVLNEQQYVWAFVAVQIYGLLLDDCNIARDLEKDGDILSW
jgi:hypothetical protein